MRSSRSIVVAMVFGLGLMSASAAGAYPTHDACTTLGDARTALSLMVIAKDKPAQQALDAKVQAASAKLDSELARLAGTDAQLANEVKDVWEQFKATREQKIIPAIYKGDTKDAKKIARGVQYVRLSKMWNLMSCK